MLEAVGYLRVSSYSQLSTNKRYKHSFRRQSESINEYAEKSKINVNQFFFDCINGEVPFSKRPGGEALLDYVNNRNIPIILCEDWSRFSRTPKSFTEEGWGTNKYPQVRITNEEAIQFSSSLLGLLNKILIKETNE